MEFSGDYRFEQSAQRIWAALNDPVVLKQTIPGCEEIERLSGSEFAAVIKIAVGPMKLRFSGRISLSDLDPPWRYTISCAGSGGLAGLAKGTARVTMSPYLHHPLGHGTILRYHTEVALSGMIATLAEKLLHGTASRLADDFVARFAAQIPPEPREATRMEAAVAAPAASITAPGTETPPPAPVERQRGLHPVVWSIGLSLLTGLILAFSVR